MNDFDNCFRSGDEQRTVADALARFDANLHPAVAGERIATRAALGRVLAEDVIARHDSPPHDNSAVDGYVVYFDDLAPGGETQLPVAMRIAAGHPSRRALARGSAAQIFTGAAIPKGADGAGPDTVFMVEDCRRHGETVILPAGIARGANRRRAGEDVKAGDRVLRAGSRLRPQDIAMVASMGYADLVAFAKLRVAIFSTGDEVREPGGALDAGGIYDANRYALIGMLERLGCAVGDLGIFADDAAVIRDAIAHAAETHDLLITSGGVSHGEEDHVRAAIASLGAVSSWNLAIKPGRSIALGHVRVAERAVPFIGLPGNPVAVMVTFLCIARPIVLRLAGAVVPPAQAFKVASGFDFGKKTGRREWLRARLVRTERGLSVEKFPDDGSGILTSMVATDGLVELAEESAGVRKGEMVDFLPYTELMG